MCGNGVVDAGEQCDDGNLTNGDGCSAQCITETCAPLPSGLLGWWPGDGTAADISGNGRNGTLVNGAGFAAGQTLEAFAFDGVDDHVEIADDPAWTFGGDFTVDLWARFDSISNDQFLIGHDEGNGSVNKWIFLWRVADGLRMHINSPSLGAGVQPVQAAWTPTIGVWHHLAATRTGSTWKLYIDGAQAASGSDSTPIPDAAAPLRIGDAEPTGFMHGRIDEVQIFGRALSPTEIQAAYLAGTAGHCRDCAAAGVQDGALCSGDGIFCNGAEHCESGICNSPGDPCTAGGSCANTCAEVAQNCYAATGTSCVAAGSPCLAATCDGTGSCEVGGPGNTGVQCRAAAGPCDVAETCDGVSGTCPPDVIASAGTTCQASAGACAVADTCDGVNVTCPSNGILPAGTECRAAAGACDVVDRCDGVSPLCPADAKSTAVCRPIGVVCDVAESCDGSGDQCPADAVAPICDPPVRKCAADKLKTAGKYALCRLKADAKAAKKGTAPDYSKCAAQFGDTWSGAEAFAGGACPTEGDGGVVDGFWQECTDMTTALLGGLPAPPPASCQAAKLKAAGKYALCRSKADAKAAKTRDPADYTKCDAKLVDAFGKAEAIGGCATTGDAAAVQSLVTTCTEVTVVDVAGGPAPLGRFIDNRDGTITDTLTQLMWEKKVGGDNVAHAAQPHEVDNLYAWAGHCSVATTKLCQPNPAAAAVCVANVAGDPTGCGQCLAGEGTCTVDAATVGTVWDWLAQFDAGAGFDGQTDWRLPTVAELESILDYSIAPPPVDVAFDGAQCGAACTDLSDPACSCTSGAAGLGYSTGITQQGVPGSAWAVRFDAGPVYPFAKDGPFFVRAVRGGSVPPMPRFTHNADGTVSDAEANLMWEPKVELNGVANGANPHDADNLYAWAGSCSLAPGTLCQPSAAAAAACAAGVEGAATGCGECGAGQGTCVLDPGAVATIWQWIGDLNAGGGFAGHTDWRLPRVSELETIADYGHASPAVDPLFAGPSCGAACTDVTDAACSCTRSWGYHSATTTASDYAWYVFFADGSVNGGGKIGANHLRAVRTMP